MLLHNTYGVDLGTSTVKIYNQSRNAITKEKNMIAIKDRKTVLAVGNEAYEMFEKTPENISVDCPMAFGRIADVGKLEAVLHTLLQRSGRSFGWHPAVYFAVPTDMTEIEKRAYYTMTHKGRLKKCRVFLVDKPIADAIALGVPLNKTKGSLLVNIGAQSTEISVIADARVIISKIVPLGGRQFNEAICENIRKKNNFIVGTKTAKRLKLALNDILEPRKEGRKVFGMDTVSGLPRECVVSTDTVREAVEQCISGICDEIQQFLERTPPQIHRSILKEGIYLTGGSTRIPNIEKYLSHRLDCPVTLSQHYELCTICGLQELITHKALHRWAYSVKKRKRR